jgi:hypothetical protein
MGRPTRAQQASALRLFEDAKKPFVYPGCYSRASEAQPVITPGLRGEPEHQPMENANVAQLFGANLPIPQDVAVSRRGIQILVASAPRLEIIS